MTMNGTDRGAPAAIVTKGFVDVGGRLLHYVRRGQGPAVVLLHASPCSAKVMESLQAAWSGEFTTFAFDLPGFGLSDLPLAENITIEVLADCIAGGMRALGISAAALYGRHTGAGVCLEIARKNPDLVSLLLTDGLPVFSKPYSEERLAEYLPSIEPRWDGGHLTWTFFRYREQHMFWPWDAGDLAHRADADMPDLDFLYRGTVELLEAAPTYQRVYRAAFLYDSLANIGELKMPAVYGNRPGDSQFATMKRYPEWADTRVMPREAELAERAELEVLRQHPAAGSVPAWRSRFDGPARPSELRDYLETRHGMVYARGVGLHEAGSPLLFLHDMPGGIDRHLQEMKTLAAGRPVIGFDLGGNGKSDIEQDFSLGLGIEQIEDVLAALGWNTVDIHAHGTSAALAVAFAGANPARVGALTLRSPALLTDEERSRLGGVYAPDISPASDGGNFLRLWHHLRDQELWWPWFEQNSTTAKASEPRIDPVELNQRAVTLLKQPRHYRAIWQAILSQDLPAMLAALGTPCEILVQDQDIFAHTAERYLRGGDAKQHLAAAPPERPASQTAS